MRAVVAVLLVAATLSHPAHAVDWHLGIGAAAELDGRTPDVGDLEPDAETARALVAGLAVGTGFGLEAGWVDLGEASVSAVADAGYRVDGDLWSLGLTWTADTGALQPYAKLGWFSRSESGQALTIVGTTPVDFDDDGVMAELGGRWFITDQFALRAGYTWYDFEPDADGSIGLLAELHFR